MAKKTIDELRELSAAIDDLYDAGKADEGRELLRQALEHAKESDPAYEAFFQAEWAGFEEKDHEKQKTLMEQALALAPGDFFLLRNMGVVLSMLGKMDVAIAWFDKALAENPKDWNSMRDRGVSLSKQGKMEEAMEWFAKALAENPKDWKAMRNRGVSLSKQGKDDEAIEWFDKALSENPKDCKAMRNRGVSLSMQGNDDEATEWFDKALTANPKDWNAMRDRGVSLSKQGKDDEATEWFDKALTANPKDWNAMRERGVSLSKQGKDDEAIEWYAKALAENPKDWNAMRDRGVSLSKQGKEDEAIEWFAKALAENPKDWDAMRQRGVSLSKQGKEDEAIEWFAKALAENPKDWNAMRQRGVSLSKQGKMEEAIAWYDKALAENPKDWDAMRQRGASLHELGNHAEALEWLLKASQENSQDEAAFYWLALVYYALGDAVRAWSAIERACELAPNDVFNQQTRDFLAREYGNKVAKKENVKREKEKTDTKQYQDLVALIRNVRKFLDEPNELLEEMAKNLKRFEDFQSAKPAFAQDRSLFMVLRKWNSYTPAIPTLGDEDNVGGGYYLLHEGVGTVIDPGYDFIKNFAYAGGRFADIHNIVITHAHNDHTIDFESLLTLAHKYNKDVGPKKLNIYMNLGAYQKFSGLIDLRDMRYIERVRVLEPNPVTPYTLGSGLTMTAVPAFHDEIVSDKYAVGLRFAFTKGTERQVVLLTSDTSLHPWRKAAKKDEKDEVLLEDPIWKHYQALGGVDVLIPHLGSIKPEELKGGLELIKEPGKVFYMNHLGILGVAMLIANLKPKLVLVSEFGAELKSVQKKIIGVLREVMKLYWENSREEQPKILPADVTLIYDVWGESMYCISKKEFVSYKQIDFKRPNNSRHFYYTSEQDKDRLFDSWAEQTTEFDESRHTRTLPGVYNKA